MEASWWERLSECGENCFVLMGGVILSKSLIQLSVDGWGCVPSLLFELRQNCGEVYKLQCHEAYKHWICWSIVTFKWLECFLFVCLFVNINLALSQIHEEWNGNPPQYSCLGNSMDKGVLWAMVHEVPRVGQDWETKLLPTTILDINDVKMKDIFCFLGVYIKMRK